jgi:L-2-hydroxyglutarate oxidase
MCGPNDGGGCGSGRFIARRWSAAYHGAMDDYCIIGGGIIGLATALQLLERRPGAALVLLEKEAGVARHQTGHNSGVIHSGIYYAPGSLKAKLCRQGALATVAFCRAHGVAHEICGKMIVATNALELSRLDMLQVRGGANNIACERIDGTELMRREPDITGLGALFIPSTGIVDYPAMCRAMAARILALGGRIELNVAVTAIVETDSQVMVHAGERSWSARQLVACAGLQADRIARLGGIEPDFRIIPFRGEYYRLPAAKAGVAKTLIYPVPDPDLPFLGIHLTRMIDGGMTVGPNAVLGLAREKYAKFATDWRDIANYLRFPGFWRMIGAHLGAGLVEMRNSLLKRYYLEACRKYCPSLELPDLRPEPAGIRAQAVMRDGSIVQDFLLRNTARSIHVCNAPSPAATSALPIGSMIAEAVLQQRPAIAEPSRGQPIL